MSWPTIENLASTAGAMVLSSLAHCREPYLPVKEPFRLIRQVLFQPPGKLQITVLWLWCYWKNPSPLTCSHRRIPTCLPVNKYPQPPGSLELCGGLKGSCSPLPFPLETPVPTMAGPRKSTEALTRGTQHLPGSCRAPQCCSLSLWCIVKGVRRNPLITIYS